MITSGSHSRLPTLSATIQFLVRTKWVFGLAIAALFAVAATPPQQVSDEDTDQQYIHIMNLMDRADALRASGKADAAKAKDVEAYKALIIFQKIHPRWYQKSVQYRLNQLDQEIEGKPAETTEEEPAPIPKPHPNLEAPAKTTSTSSANSPVKLLDAGKEPRRVLRMHLKAGDKQTMILTVKLNQQIDFPGMPAAAKANMSPKIPAISMSVDTTIQSVAPNGDASYEMVFGEPGVADEPGTSPQVLQALKSGLKGIKGLTIDGVISDQGVNKKADSKTPPNADPQMRQTVDQIKEGMANMGMPLPDGAIGAGAKWEVKAPAKVLGASLDQTSDFQLVSADGDHVSTTFTQTQSAANQKIQSPAMGQVNVQQMTNNSTGTVTSDLSKLLPPQATIDIHSEVNAEITARGKTQPFTQKTDETLSIATE